MQQKIDRALGEQEAAQDSLHDINGQLALWQAALGSHRPGKGRRLLQVLEEITNAKEQLGNNSERANYQCQGCLLVYPVISVF